ncbi:MFS transporter [Erwinia pyrifoliae]|uniref:MFS transporter n=1 Tax=Erwinia pyrifoliae TaxID=79967 RepID=A0ABY5X892_ERWPY|nr:MFS transporter [Erwinia pyrifoliae]AUX71069.1 MFS transporter [Erwinia pyrifoliae]MCA8875225.1 MFS transporter [Erwinia pyrifoliae]UWS33614.1 MFS transporter [Erwinia pyrifoliae]UXK12303.1 MFS transporter [Erwinia pyrifoliae]CAX57435.1 General substrate transporter:Major facilitator superfamily [Erwinia pyrifoliae Ep1/96]
MSNQIIAPKRWWYIMPIVFISYSLAYLDRANFSFASAAGINEDLGITKGVSSLLGALFFLGYFFFQIPGAIYAERRSVKKLVFWCLILWGICATLTGLVSNIPMLAAIRFTLGVVEAAVMPAMLIYISNWFVKSERSRANTFLMLGNPVTVLWMSVVSGYLINAFGWREMFIIEGFPAVIWAVVWWFLVQDKPEQAKWLSDGEKAALQAQLEKEQQNLRAVRNYSEAFKSRNVIILCTQYFCWSIGVYGFVLWLPSILRNGSQMGMVEAGWLSSVPYLAATVAMIVVSWASDKLQNRKLFVWPLLLLGALAFIASYLVGSNHFWLSYALLVIAGAAMYAPYGPFFAIIPEMLPRNVAGGAMALINAMGALGSFLGSWVVGYLNGATGSPAVSYIFMGGALLVAVCLMLIVKPAQDTPSSLPHGALSSK